MTKTPRLLTAFLPLVLVLACSDDTTADSASGTESETGDGDGDSDSGDGDGDSGDGDGDSGDGDGDPATATDSGDGDGDSGDGDGDSGDGDGDSGDGDGDSGDGDGDSGDGDGDMTGDGDGDMMPGETMLRVLHLGVDAPGVDVYVDGGMMPAVAGLEFQQGTDYLAIPAGPHDIAITAAGDTIDNAVFTIDGLDLMADTKYSAVAHDYLESLGVLALVDDDADIDPANTRMQVTHAAPDVGQVDIWALADPPVLLIENLDYGTSTTLDLPAGPAVVGIDVDDDMIPDVTYDVPDLGAGNFVDVYAVNEAGGAPVFLLGHLNDGTTARIDAHVCGNDIVEGIEACDGPIVETCDELGLGMFGTPTCDMCMGIIGCTDTPPWGDDFEGMGLGNWWTQSGTNPFVITNAEFQEGAASGTNSDIGNNQSAGVEVTLDFPAAGEVNFWYRVSSETNWDYLQFYVDGALVDEWSGVVDWTEANYPIDAGQHTLEWIYDKDGSVSSNADTAWVDNITTTNGVLP